jgi:predicted  nucleic acid-binding Zn-ribbon protein
MLFGRIKGVIYGAAFLALIGLVWAGANFVRAKYEAEREVERLELAIENYESAIQALQRQAAQKEQALKAANAARSRTDNLERDINRIRRNAASAPEEDNAPIAPVLRRALDDIERLRDQ